MSPHPPKIAALEALERDRLSEAGRRRVERHLARCGACREALAAIRAYRALASEAGEASQRAAEAFDWRRVEERLAREAAELARRASRGETRGAPPSPTPATTLEGARARRLAAMAALLAAAALLWLFVRPQRSVDHEPAATAPSAPLVASSEEPPPAPPSASVADEPRRPDPAVVSLVLGEVWLSPLGDGAVPTRAALGARFERGTLETGARGLGQFGVEPHGADGVSLGSVRVALGASTRLVVAPTALSEAAPGTVALGLSAGRIAIDGFESGARIVVLAGQHRVEVRWAEVTIDLEEGAPTIVVDTLRREGGEVVVIAPDGTRHPLSADGSWPREARTAPFEPMTFAALEGASLSIAYPGAVRFEVGAERFAGGPELALRVPRAPVTIRVFDAAGRAFRAEVDPLGDDPITLGPSELRAERAERAERARGSLRDEDIAARLRESQGSLRRCYEAALRRYPYLGSGTLRARVSVNARGEVREVSVRGESIPPVLDACIRDEASAWRFPAPGGDVTFEVPLRFLAER